jgi:hypothetical protein
MCLVMIASLQRCDTTSWCEGIKLWKIFVTFRRHYSLIHCNITDNIKAKWEYNSLLNAGIKTSTNVAVFIAGSWGCGTSAARPGREYRHILLLFISIYCTETLPSYPSCEFDGRVQLIAEVQKNLVLFRVVRFARLQYCEVEN